MTDHYSGLPGIDKPEDPVVEGDEVMDGAMAEPEIAQAPDPAAAPEPVREVEIPVAVAKQVPAGDYGEILSLQKQIMKRHSRNMFDNVSNRWWKRIEEICAAHSG